MCGRYTQYQAEVRYLERLNWQAPLAFEPSEEPLERYNVAPTTRVQLLHRDEDGLRISAVPWRYAPHWAQAQRDGKPRPHGKPVINATIEEAPTNPYWREAWKNRCLVMADGWYEWVADPEGKAGKQPYYIRLKSGEPMFWAAIGRFPRGAQAQPSAQDGFAVITTASERGMVDIHDRTPVVLPPDAAREWVEPGLSSERAVDLARHHTEPAAAFEWFRVGKAVGNVRNDGRELIKPLPETLAADPSLIKEQSTFDLF
tara:strand:+ start:770 stop:1543 length:774 start_codon:yes stop_codon:yes gene_type:complete